MYLPLRIRNLNIISINLLNELGTETTLEKFNANLHKYNLNSEWYLSYLYTTISSVYNRFTRIHTCLCSFENVMIAYFKVSLKYKLI